MSGLWTPPARLPGRADTRVTRLAPPFRSLRKSRFASLSSLLRLARNLVVQRIISYLLRCDHETTHIDPIYFCGGVAADHEPFPGNRKKLPFCRGHGPGVRTPRLSLLRREAAGLVEEVPRTHHKDF